MVNGKTYPTGEVAKRIMVEPVTVRKYTQMLKEKGYVFEKDQKGWRQFKETDLHAFNILLRYDMVVFPRKIPLKI